LVVVRAANVTWRHTRVLFVIVPPGTAAHAVPVQYWTSKPRRPHDVNVIVGVGSDGAE
jgi:hypothetical protein